MNLKWFQYTLLLLVSLQLSTAEECDCDGFFCVSDTEFQLCVNGETVGDRIPCITGAVCGNGTETQCSPQLLCQEKNACKAEGIFRDKNSKYRYFTCALNLVTSEWDMREYICPEGTYFLEGISSCGSEEVNSETKFSCPGQGYFPDPENCEKFFQCDEGSNAYIRYCPETTYFDVDTKTCITDLPERCLELQAPAAEPFCGEDSGNQGVSTVQPSTSQTDNDETSTVYSTQDPSTVEPSTLQTDNDEMSTVYSTQDPSTVEPSTLQTNNDELSTVYSTEDPSTIQSSTSQTDNDETSTVYSTQDPRSTVEPSTLQTNNDEMSTVYSTEAPSTTDEDYTTDNRGDIVTSTPKRDTVSTTMSSPKYDDEKQNGFVCPEEGFYPDPEDCNRYFVCNSMGIAIQILCPENTFYDIDLQGCTSDMPDRCLPPPPDFNFFCTTQGFFPDPENCQRYYICKSNGMTTSVSCPEYHYYDEENMLCSLNKPERCTSSDKPSNDYTSTTLLTTVVPTKGTTTVTPNIEDQKTTTRVPEEDEFQCPGGGYFPHPKDCQRYFICTKYDNLYILQLITCPENKNFDLQTKTCTDEIPERCQYRTTTLVPTTPEPVTDFPSTSVTTPKDNELNTTTFVCYNEGYHPDPEDCRRYYVCTEGIAIWITCPENTFFNDVDEMCTFDLPERCQSSTTPRYPIEPTTPARETGFICPGEGYYPDPDDCRSYYVCTAGILTPITCPENTFFNDVDEMCTFDLPERCQSSTTPRYPEESTTPARETGFICPGEGYYPNPEDCQTYFLCHGSRFGTKILCPDKTYYNEKTTYCSEEVPERCRTTDEPPQNETPTLRPPVQEFICPGEGYFADPRDCQKYYVCVSNNFSMSASCPANTFYDADTTYCTSEMPERCMSTTPDDHVPTTPAPKEEEFRCPGKGYFPDPKNCQRYFFCFEFGLSISFTCPVNTYFDEKYAFCTSKMPARCGEESTGPPQENGAGKFVCEVAGMFPDKKDCQKYWVCFEKDLGYSVECPKGTYYHEDSFFCLKQVPERCKQSDGFRCPGEGFFADPFDCNLYHVCYPWGIDLAARCPENTYYNDEANSCDVDMPQRCKNVGNSLCPKAGSYPDPEDCSSYFVCDSRGRRTSVKCPENEYFDEKQGKCSSEIPERCKKDVTTTETPTTSSEEFICNKRGSFPIEDDCYRYYYCSKIGSEAVISNCPKNQFFNISKGRCRKIKRGDECSRRMEDDDEDC